jgi:hypothetical protein
MRPDELRQYLNRRPFRAFRLHLSSGAFFDVRNPHMASVGRAEVTLGLGIEGDRQRFAVIALIHIVWLEALVPVL